MGSAEINIWCISEAAFFGEFAVEGNFGGNFIAEHIGAEFGEVSLTLGDGGEILLK